MLRNLKRKIQEFKIHNKQIQKSIIQRIKYLRFQEFKIQKSRNL